MTHHERETGRRPRPALPGPSELDQIAVFVSEEELGRQATTIDELIDMSSWLPFEPAVSLVARLNLQVEAGLMNPDHHVAVAQSFFAADAGLVGAYDDVLANDPTALCFSPQAFALLTRLLIDHARDEPLRDLTDEELAVLRACVLGAHSALGGELDETALIGPERMIAYELQAASFFHRPPKLETMTRHRQLVEMATSDPRLTGSVNYVPVAEWLAASGLDFSQQWAVGFGLAAMTGAYGDRPVERVDFANVEDLLVKLGLAHMSPRLDVIAADRADLRAAFQRVDPGGTNRAWETRPFKSAPFVRLVSGDLVLLGSQWVMSWLGDGFHYRALTHAQLHLGSAQSARYTRYVGEVVERYALDLAEACVPAPNRVHGEQPYDNGASRTSDVAVVWADEDLMLFEVHSRRVSAATAVSGDAIDAASEITKLLVVKADQLGVCVSALLEKAADIPDLDMDSVVRIWPVVVSVGHVMQTSSLWTYIHQNLDPRKTQSFSDDRVQPLQAFTIGDYEKLMGIVESGRNLSRLFSRRVSGPFLHRDLASWLHGDMWAPSDKPRPTMLEAGWSAMGDDIAETVSRLAPSADADPTK